MKPKIHIAVVFVLLHLHLLLGDALAQDATTPIQRVVADAVFRTPLNEVGQSGVCVSDDRLFLTVHQKLEGPLKSGFYFNSDIVGQCFDRNSGKLLWQVELPGSYPGRVLESWHDGTSLTPVANAEYVVFHNLNGMLGCYTLDGKLVWERSWQAPDPDIKNCRMLLHEGAVIVSLPINAIAVAANEKHPELPFYCLHCIDLASGEERWVSNVLLHHGTQYSIGQWRDEKVIVASMIDLSHWKFGQGRFGYLLSLSDGAALKKFELPPTIPHQKNQLCDGCFLVTSATGGAATVFKLVDPIVGTVQREVRMDQPDQYFRWNGSTYELADFKPLFSKDRTLRGKGMPTPSTVHVVGKKIYFWRYDTSAIGCLDVSTGKSTLLQAPLQVREDTTVWFTDDFKFTDGIQNSSGQPVNMRIGSVRGIQRGGFGHTNPAWPKLHDGKLYWMNGAGVLYVINTNQAFGPDAIQWLAMSPATSAWTFGSVAVDNEAVYVRSQQELVRFNHLRLQGVSNP
ncbi:MAG: hypothetical protein P8L85_17345 [Rubripirellula sp.]|nr:hypothetical protein [Rubripirellula sp.]